MAYSRITNSDAAYLLCKKYDFGLGQWRARHNGLNLFVEDFDAIFMLADVFLHVLKLSHISLLNLN